MDHRQALVVPAPTLKTKSDIYRDNSVHLLDSPETIIDLVEKSGSTYSEWEKSVILVIIGK